MLQQSLEELTKKEMSRKEFLALVGLGIASIFGVANILKQLGGKQHKSVHSGYGGSVYGGAKR